MSGRRTYSPYREIGRRQVERHRQYSGRHKEVDDRWRDVQFVEEVDR